MSRWLRLPLMALITTSALAQAPLVQRTAKMERPGVAQAVRVADGPMVFTGQIFAPAGKQDAREEAEEAIAALAATLKTAGSDLSQVVRLTVYAPDDATVTLVDALVAERFAAAPVALTVVRTPLARMGARVAFEAAAVSTRTSAAVAHIGPDAAVLPAGGKIFISGQAERSDDLAAASRLTMAGLRRSLAHLGLAPGDIVQVKAFVRPFSDHAAASRAIAESFAGAPVPPIVLMEWVSDLFAEIEIVAAAKTLSAPPGETITHSWLPWLTKSPRYCHVAFVPAGTPLIFIGAIDGAGAGDDRAQMKAIFERLGSVLFDAGSSYRNLAKATYYLHGPPTRALLGDIRGVYFDPTRPPAASALVVAAPPRPGQAAAIDLIAVPVK